MLHIKDGNRFENFDEFGIFVAGRKAGFNGD
jgi:hypothetical protein